MTDASRHVWLRESRSPPILALLVSDLPLELRDPELTDRLARALDVEGKIARAFDALGPIDGRDVVLVDGDGGHRARQLAGLGARLVALERPVNVQALAAALEAEVPRVVVAAGDSTATGRPDASADVVVSCWSSFRGPEESEVREADRILRPGGRLLVLHDYGRDDVSRLLPADRPEYATWSRREGPFLASGFKVRVIHCWWTFPTLEEATSVLRDGFGDVGASVAATLVRPRLSYNVAIYHRTRPEPAD
jgi:SAM-dependent methyltransferase